MRLDNRSGGGTVTAESRSAGGIGREPRAARRRAADRRERLARAVGVSVERLEPRALLSVNPLDPTFGNGGTASATLPGSTSNLPYAVALAPDGSTVLAGRSMPLGGSVETAVVAKLRPDGSLDPTFGPGGRVTLPVAATLKSVAVLSDGRVLTAANTPAVYRLTAGGLPDPTYGGGDGVSDGPVATFAVSAMAAAPDGSAVVVGAANGAFAVARYRPDGTLDPTFDGDGVAAVDVGPADDAATAVAVRPDGSVVVVGRLLRNGPGVIHTDLAVARLRPDGSPDPTFGTAGVTVVGYSDTSGSPAQDTPTAVALGPDGRVVVVGAKDTHDGRVTVFTAAGQLDPTFSGDGKLELRSQGQFFAVAVAPDGRIVVGGGGLVGQSNIEAPGLTVFRFDAAGNRDATFDGDGVAVAVYPANDTQDTTGLAVSADGRVTAVGTCWGSPDTRADFAVARWTAAGTPDATFDGDGKTAVDVTAPTPAAGTAVAVQPDGKILVTAMGGNAYLPVLRYHPDGTPDAEFGDGTRAGVANPDPTSFTALSQAVAVAPDGKVVVGGTYKSGFALARYTADGTPDPSFGTGGLSPVQYLTGGDGYHAADELRRILVQPDGKILAAGEDGDCWGLARYTGDGLLDPTFGTGGEAPAEFSRNGEGIAALALQSDGKVVVAGLRYVPNSGEQWSVARYLSSGTLDASFGGGDGVADFGTPGGSWSQGVGGVVVLSNGRIVVGGNQLDGQFTLYGLTPSGEVDPAFGTAGRVVTPGPTGGRVSSIAALTVRGDGTLLAVGSGFSPGASSAQRLVAAAYDANGALVRTFGTNGQFIAPAAGPTFAVDAAADAAGRLLAVPYAGPVLVRYLTTPTLSVSATGVTTEAAIPQRTTVGSFTFTRGGDLSVPLTVPLAVGGTAAGGTDYQPLPAGVTFAPGAESVTVQVTAVDDFLTEGNETVTATVTPPAGYTLLPPASAVVTITDNEGPDRLEPNDAVAEGTDLGTPQKTSLPLLSIHYGGDVDFFKLTAPAGELAAQVTFARGLGDLQLQVFDAEQTLVATAAAAGDTRRAVVPVPAAGTYYLKVSAAPGNAGGNPDYTLAVDAQRPYFGTTPPAVGPGVQTRLQAENFDLGGPAVAYLDGTPANTGVPGPAGGLYRPDEQVDVSYHATGNGYHVADTAPGEYLEYTVNVAEAGRYLAEFRVANVGAGGAFHLAAGPADLTGAVAVPDTGSGEAFTTVSRLITLPAGRYPLRLAMDAAAPGGAGLTGQAGRFDWILLTPAVQTVSVVAADPVATEAGGPGGSNPGLFVVRRVGTADAPLLVTYTVAGTATAGADYAPLTGRVTIPAGETSAVLPVRPVGGDAAEPAETVAVAVADAAAYRASATQRSALVTVYDGASADRYEAGDTRATARSLGSAARRLDAGLSVHAGGNDDYYSYTAAGGRTVVRLSFLNAQGDLNLSVLSTTGAVIGQSTTTADGEQVAFDSTAGEAFVVRVYGAAAAVTNPDYSIIVERVDPTGPEASVRAGRFDVSDGQADQVDLGTAVLDGDGHVAASRSDAREVTFTVTNDGAKPLTLGAVTLPAGVRLVAAPPPDLAAGASGTFTVALDPGAGRSGAVGGTVSLATNDPDEGSFDVPVFGTVVVPPRVEAIVVGDGSASRSVVRTVTVRFDRAVDVGAVAFGLTPRGGGGSGGGAGTPVPAQVTPSADGRSWELSFSGGSWVGGSLTDGVYDLVVRAAEVGSADAGERMAADQSFAFHRLFGDADGSRGVNNADYLLFRNAFGRAAGDPAYKPAFDADGSGTVNNADYLQFRNRFGKTFEY